MIYLSKIKCVPRLLKLKAAKWYATDIWKCHVSIVKLRKTVEFQFNFRPRFLHFWASGIHMFLVQHILARHPLLRERIAEHQSYFLMIWFLAVTFLVIMLQKSSFLGKRCCAMLREAYRSKLDFELFPCVSNVFHCHIHNG